MYAHIFRNIASLFERIDKWAETLRPFKFGLFVAALCGLLFAFLELLGLIGFLNYPTGIDEDGKKITTVVLMISGSYFVAYLTRLDERP